MVLFILTQTIFNFLTLALVASLSYFCRTMPSVIMKLFFDDVRNTDKIDSKNATSECFKIAYRSLLKGIKATKTQRQVVWNTRHVANFRSILYIQTIDPKTEVSFSSKGENTGWPQMN